LQSKQHFKPVFTHFLFTTACCLLAALSFIQCSSKKFDCSRIHNGTFHFYSKFSKTHYILLRQDSLQTEIDLTWKDTSYWKISWMSDCIYTAQYLYGGHWESEEQKQFVQQHLTVIQVQQLGEDYYIFKGTLDSLNSERSRIDTIWLHPKQQ
jgi:hypothetical protein